MRTAAPPVASQEAQNALTYARHRALWSGLGRPTPPLYPTPCLQPRAPSPTLSALCGKCTLQTSQAAVSTVTLSLCEDQLYAATQQQVLPTVNTIPATISTTPAAVGSSSHSLSSMLPGGHTMSEAVAGNPLQRDLVSSEQDKAQLSSTVWIILFFILMLLSVVTNTIYVVGIFKSKKNISPIHVLLCSFFLINLVDYALLIFEFYHGPDSNYHFSHCACAFYQFIEQGNPLLYIGVILLLVYQTYMTATHPATETRTLTNLFLQFLFVIISSLFLSIPPTLYSKVTTSSNTSSHCTLDLSSSDEDTSDADKALTAVFLLIFKSVLPYWLPLAMISVPIIRIIRMDKILADKQLDVSMAVTVTLSFVVFHLPYYSAVFTRFVTSLFFHCS